MGQLEQHKAAVSNVGKEENEKQQDLDLENHTLDVYAVQ